MVRKAKKLESKTHKTLHNTNTRAFKAKRSKKPILNKRKNEIIKVTSQTLNTKHGKITIDDKQLKKSSTKKNFFSKYEVGKLIKEGGNGAVFKGYYKIFSLFFFYFVSYTIGLLNSLYM